MADMTDEQRVEMIKAFTKDQYHVYEYNYSNGSKNLWASFETFGEANTEFIKKRGVVKGWVATTWTVLIIRDHASPML